MDLYTIFIDESGWADLKESDRSPYFTVCGVVVSEKWRGLIKRDLEKLKEKYFRSKNYVIHSVSLRRDLKTAERISNFATDIKTFLENHRFFLLLVVVDKKKAVKYTWINQTVYERSYQVLLSNLVKFLVTKKTRGHICVEASNPQPDIIIYKSFFTLIANGLPALSISTKDIHRYLTSLTFVTKLNNDPEQQIADLFGYCGTLQMKIDKKELTPNSLDEINRVLFDIMQKKYFRNQNIKLMKPLKKKQYSSICPFVTLP